MSESRSLRHNSISFSVQLAKLYGVAGALILQQVHYWCETDDSPKVRDGHQWTYRSQRQWSEDLGIFSEWTIQQTMRKLVAAKVLVSANYNRLPQDRTQWYRIDYAELDRQAPKNPAMHSVETLPSITGKSSHASLANPAIQGLETLPPLHKTPLRLPHKNFAKPAASPSPNPDTLAIPEDTDSMATRTPSSASSILAALQEKKGTLKPRLGNTGQSASSIWRDEVPKLEGVGFLPAMTGKQMGQFSLFAKRCGPTSDAVLQKVVSNWVGFTKFVANAKGLKKTPDRPDIGFLLLYVHEARDYSNSSVQLVALPVKKPVILGKPLKMKPLVAPVKTEKVIETETEDVASLDDILAWKPVKKE